MLVVDHGLDLLQSLIRLVVDDDQVVTPLVDTLVPFHKLRLLLLPSRHSWLLFRIDWSLFGGRSWRGDASIMFETLLMWAASHEHLGCVLAGQLARVLLLYGGRDPCDARILTHNLVVRLALPFSMLTVLFQICRAVHSAAKLRLLHRRLFLILLRYFLVLFR